MKKVEEMIFVRGVMLREAVPLFYPHFVDFARKYNKIGGFPEFARAGADLRGRGSRKSLRE